MNVIIPKQGRDLLNDNKISFGGHVEESRMTKVASECVVDISSKNKDINAFGMEELKSFDEIKQKASVKDVSNESRALAVMSNSMSGEDLAKATKDGVSLSDMSDMSAEDTVTNIDKIKATMAASGAVIPGYTDDLSRKEIERITGSASSAMAIEAALTDNQVQITKENVKSIDETLKLAESTQAPTDDAKKYLISNELEPTVNNFYTANFSSHDAGFANKATFYKDSTGYVGINPKELNIEELKPQIEKIIEQSGLEINEKSLTDAKWLLEKNLPLTEENLKKLQDINSVVFPLTEQTVANACAVAIADGIDVKDASLTNTESIVNRAGRFVREISEFINKNDTNDVSERRMLEETRLALTIEASLSLAKKGIEIDTSDLQKLVEDLKQAEKEYFEPFLMDEKSKGETAESIAKYDEELSTKLDIYKQTVKAVDEIAKAPIDVVGGVVANVNHVDNLRSSDFVPTDNTIREIAKAATQVKSDFDKANKAYETMMTSPRYDMGDSIKKAFRNVDDILEDLGIEVNRLNEKAVRALGYAGIEINEDSINTALKAEVAVENVITHMTPARTLKMIRDGENPLDTDLFELSDKLMEEDIETQSVKYSEFLYKLEKSGEITEEEKKAFIGIYRLFNKIEKSDGKLVGDVIKAEEKLSLSNLLTMSRNDRQIGNDFKIDDTFGALEKLITSGESITDQILSGFKDKEKDQAYVKEEADALKNMVAKEEAVLKVLENTSEPASPINMAAVDALINQRGSLFKGLKEKDDKLKESFEAEKNKLIDGFDDEETAQKAYKSFTEKTQDLLKESAENADTYIDVRSIKLLNKQLSIVGKMADSRTYEVPVEINGEITSINLKIVSDDENAGKVKASFETEATGKVNAEFALKDGNVSGFIVTENSYFEDVIKEKEQSFRQEFEEADINVSSMYYTSSRGVNIKGNYTEDVDTNTPSTKQLYMVAKAIIKAIQK